MPTKMSNDEMQRLAQKIAKMRYLRAKGYVRGLDKASILEAFRTAVGTDQWLTRYALPNKGLLITLVEQKETYGATSPMGYKPTRFKFVEARVEELPASHMNDNQGNDPHKQ
jgi:hypothetical protein